MANFTEHADGVYLGLHEDAYFADGALGSSSIKALHSSPPDWWWTSPYNELRPPEAKKKAFTFGTALHVALLEGIDTFKAVYGVLPSKWEHRDALDTIDDLKAFLRDKGEKVTGAKGELIERALACDPGVQILDVIQNEWRKQGRRELSRDDYNRIVLMERLLMGRADSPTALGRAFTGGLSEVSVFWTDDNGIRHKARIDKLKANASVDLKSFSNWADRQFDQAIIREIAMRRYPVQAVHYEEARRQLRRLFREDKVFGGTPEQHDALKEIAAAELWNWVWVTYKADGAPRAKAIPMEWATETAVHRPIYDRAWRVRQEALLAFLQYRETYGLGWRDDGSPYPMWVDPETILPVSIEDWPIWAAEVD